MSLFDKDIIEKDIGYNPDIGENISLQIQLEFRRLVDWYKKELLDCGVNLMDWLWMMLQKYMDELTMSSHPKNWKGPYQNIFSYNVWKRVDDKMQGFDIQYRLKTAFTPYNVNLSIYEEELLDILKHETKNKR